MKHVFIINPSAGKKKGMQTLLEQAEAIFGGEQQILWTRQAGDARTLARQALDRAAGEPVRLYACGGDGTLNEVVNAAAGVDSAAVTNIPLGTGNDFLKLFGKDWKTRFRDLAALRDGPQASFDLIDCNGLLGLDIVCAGVDARVAANVHRYKRLPLVTGIGAYILSLATEVVKGVTCPMEVQVGEFHYRGPVTLLCVCNGQYYGGGFRPMPEARPDDGVLDMLLVGEIKRRQVPKYVGKYAAGRYGEIPDIVRDFHGREMTLTSPGEIVAVVDGEVLRSSVFTIRLSQKKLNFFWPAGMSCGSP